LFPTGDDGPFLRAFLLHPLAEGTLPSLPFFWTIGRADNEHAIRIAASSSAMRASRNSTMFMATIIAPRAGAPKE